MLCVVRLLKDSEPLVLWAPPFMDSLYRLMGNMFSFFDQWNIFLHFFFQLLMWALCQSSWQVFALICCDYITASASHLYVLILPPLTYQAQKKKLGFNSLSLRSHIFYLGSAVPVCLQLSTTFHHFNQLLISILTTLIPPSTHQRAYLYNHLFLLSPVSTWIMTRSWVNYDS